MAELIEALDAFAPGRSRRRRSRKVTDAQLGANNHCALKLVSGSPNGCTGALTLAHGITRDVLVELTLAGLASADAEGMLGGAEMRRLKITDGGRTELE